MEDIVLYEDANEQNVGLTPIKTPDWQDIELIPEKYKTNTGFFQFWNAGGQTFTPDHSYVAAQLRLMLNQWELDRRGPFVVKITQAGIVSCWNEPILWEEKSYSTILPNPDIASWVTFSLPNISLAKGVTYRIVIHTTPGWEYWNGSEWEPWETGAAFRCWAIIYSRFYPTYPRGNHCYGCNFRDNSGRWLDTNNDLVFCIDEL